jgi:hypothetical protein
MVNLLINNSDSLLISVQLEITFKIYTGFVAQRSAVLWIPLQFDKLFEEPCSKLQGIFDRKEVSHF